MQSNAPGRGPITANCESLHEVRCDTHFTANTPSEIVVLAAQHGANVHGFTPVYYSRAKLDAMVATVTGQID